MSFFKLAFMDHGYDAFMVLVVIERKAAQLLFLGRRTVYNHHSPLSGFTGLAGWIHSLQTRQAVSSASASAVISDP